MTHSELVDIGYKWLRRSKNHNMLKCYGACGIAFKEISSLSDESPDCIGFQSHMSVLIECKATRSDFLSDKNKSFRQNPDEGMGQFRIYLTNEGVCTIDELPNKWGLMEARGRGIYMIKNPEQFDKWNIYAERTLMFTVLNRIAHFDMINLINDARYPKREISFDIDETSKKEK